MYPLANESSSASWTSCQTNTPANAIATELAAFQYPPAAAKSVMLLVVVVILVSVLLRFVDIRKELQR